MRAWECASIIGKYVEVFRENPDDDEDPFMMTGLVLATEDVREVNPDPRAHGAMRHGVRIHFFDDTLMMDGKWADVYPQDKTEWTVADSEHAYRRAIHG